MTMRDIQPEHFPWFRYDGYTFSLGLTDGDEALLSGHSASRYDPQLDKIVVTGDLAAQTRTAYDKIAAILAAESLAWPDVTRIVENITVDAIGNYDSVQEVRREVLGDSGAAVRTVVVDRLLRHAAEIEIEIDAARGGATTTGRVDGWQRSAIVSSRDGVITLSTILPIGDDGSLAAHDLAGQYRYCLGRAADLLAAVGLGPSSIVKISEFSTADHVGDQTLADIRRELTGPVLPAVARFGQTRLHAPGVLVAIDVTAARSVGVAIDPGWRHFAHAASSPAVRVGRHVFLSRLDGADPVTGEPRFRDDIVLQARVAYDSLIHLLGDIGADATAVIQTVEYVTAAGLRHYRGVAAVRSQLLRAPWPASTGAVCASLGDPDLLFGVDATARLP